MTLQHRVPQTPEELPQQRLVPVLPLPELPANLEIKVVFLRVAELEGLPESPGSDSRFLASVEWAWSPMNNRQDSYYLSQDARGWYLWNCYFEDIEHVDFECEQGFVSLQPSWFLLAHCNRLNIPEREVALHLLRAFLKDERHDSDTELDRFHFIADLGELTIADLHAVGTEVWAREEAAEREGENE